jgi:hypothetical protein
VEFIDRDTYYERRQSMEGFYRLSRNLPRGVLTVGLSDYYATIEPIGGSAVAGSDYSQNTFSASAGYRTPLFKRGQFGLASSYAHTRGNSQTREDYSVRLDYNLRYGKFLLAIESNVYWRVMEDQAFRQDFLHLRLTRFF